jgi:hypothetical protein
MPIAAQTVPDWAIGCTERSYISLDGGERDPSIAVWIQTESQYFDLRIPHDRARIGSARSLSDLDRADLLELARQSGDTGTCTIEAGVATWTSWSDRFGFYCDDVAMFPDDGRLEPTGGTIYEYETSKSPVRYEEAWVRQPYDHGLVAHLTLCDEAAPGRPLGVLAVTGRYAGFVERSTSENQMTLEAQLDAAAGDCEGMHAILDCEASYAVRPHAGGPYTIRHSNFPFREGRELDVPPMDRRILERRKMLPARRDDAFWRVESWFVKR